MGYHLFVRPLLDRDGAAPRRMLLCGEGDGPRRGPAGTVHALPGRREVVADGREVVRLVPGRRLAPYGRADAMVLLESEGPVGGADDGGAGPDGGGAPRSGELAGAPERSVLVLPL